MINLCNRSRSSVKFSSLPNRADLGPLCTRTQVSGLII